MRQGGRTHEVDIGVPSSEALFIIRSAWRLPSNSALFDFLPQNSYDPATGDLTDPFKDYRNLMLAIYKLAHVTRDRADEAKRALADTFIDVGEFDEEVTMDIIRKLADRFVVGA